MDLVKDITKLIESMIQTVVVEEETKAKIEAEKASKEGGRVDKR